ncbi:MAG: SDR family oxidoreductase [Ignavibacteriales bacterium]|nr:SDR family oxidoreductase [Ignavibacteriales bacterium]
MFSLKNKVVFVTGASSGIGAACARQFAALGAKLLLCARRADRLHALAAELKENHGTESFVFALDVRRCNDVTAAIDALPEAWKAISILLNNAGLARGLDNLHEGDAEDWDEMIDTNVKGLLYVSRAVIPLMVRRGEGHVINLGSIAGHLVYPKGNVYCATKFAVGALTQALRLDLNGSGIRVSSVDPGMVETEFSLVRFHGDEDRAAKTYQGLEPLTADDIAETVVYCATRPLHVNIQEVIIMPTAQASPYVLHRK